MANYLIRRIVYSIALLFVSASAIFFIVHALPGSPYDRWLREMAERNPSTKPLPVSQIERLNLVLGLDRPLPEQYAAWITGVFTGNFGESWSIGKGSPVFEVIRTRLPYTLLLMSAATILSFLIAVPLGLYSAAHQYSNGDLSITVLTYLGIAMPSFWFALMLVSIFSSALGWLPWGRASSEVFSQSGDIVTVLARVFTLGLTNQQIAGLEGKILVDGIKHMIMPTIVIAILLTARWTRFLRSSMLEVLNLEFVRTARAKGVRQSQVLIKHGLRNGMIPLITAMALDIPLLFTSVFIVEIVFSWPGIGRLFVEGLASGDWPVLHGLLIVNAVLIILFNLVADLIYPAVDPRIVYGEY